MEDGDTSDCINSDSSTDRYGYSELRADALEA